MENLDRSFVDRTAKRIWNAQKYITVLQPIFKDLAKLVAPFYRENIFADDTPCVNSLMVRGLFDDAGSKYFWVQCYQAEPEWIVENILGPIHRKWGVIWREMHGRGKAHIEWTSSHFKTELQEMIMDAAKINYTYFMVDSYSTINCKIEQTKQWQWQRDEYAIHCAA